MIHSTPAAYSGLITRGQSEPGRLPPSFSWLNLETRMSRTPWYRWYPGDYLADTYSLSWDADLLYRRILDALWIHPSLLSSPGDLSKILRTDPRKISRILPEVLPHLRETSGRLDHPKMAAQRAESEHLRATRAIAGRKGGLAKAKAKGSLRARGPDPDPDKERFNALPLCQDSRARAREAAAADLQRELEQKRASLGIETESIGSRSVAAIAAGVGASKDKA